MKVEMLLPGPLLVQKVSKVLGNQHLMRLKLQLTMQAEKLMSRDYEL
jgi:hypothetical protein